MTWQELATRDLVGNRIYMYESGSMRKGRIKSVRLKGRRFEIEVGDVWCKGHDGRNRRETDTSVGCTINVMLREDGGSVQFKIPYCDEVTIEL